MQQNVQQSRAPPNNGSSSLDEETFLWEMLNAVIDLQERVDGRLKVVQASNGDEDGQAGSAGDVSVPRVSIKQVFDHDEG